MKGDESTRSWAHLIRVMKARGPGHIKELKTALGVLVLTSQRFLAEGDDAELGCAAERRS